MGSFYFFGGIPQCSIGYPLLGTELDYSAVISPEAEQVRMAVGVINFCRFFSECTGFPTPPPGSIR